MSGYSLTLVERRLPNYLGACRTKFVDVNEVPFKYNIARPHELTRLDSIHRWEYLEEFLPAFQRHGNVLIALCGSFPKTGDFFCDNDLFCSMYKAGCDVTSFCDDADIKRSTEHVLCQGVDLGFGNRIDVHLISTSPTQSIVSRRIQGINYFCHEQNVKTLILALPNSDERSRVILKLLANHKNILNVPDTCILL